jgi:fucose permease
MTRFSRSVIWFDRLLLTAATVIMTMIALRNLRDPIGATLPTGIVLNSSTAITVIRVGFGGFPLGFAAALLGCLVSNRRLLTGISLVAAVIGAATVARIQGLLVDGVTSYNMALLRPEIVMLTLSLVAIVLERRRQQQERRQLLPGLSASR